MEFVRFIFSSFWVWLGFSTLVSLIGGGVIELVKACKPGGGGIPPMTEGSTIKVYRRVGDYA